MAVHFVTRIFHSADRYNNLGLMQIQHRPRSHVNNYSCNTMFDVYIIYIYLNDVTLIDLSL